MSEQTPTQQNPTPTASAAEAAGGGRGYVVPAVFGTAAVAVLTALLLQVVRPETAVSQAEPIPTAGRPESLGRVNGQEIPYDAVAAECVNRHGEEVLDNLINRLIIAQECQKRGVAVTDQEVVREIEDIAAKFNLPSDSWYQMLQTERGLTPEQYRRDIIWPMLALKKLAGTEVVVTEQQMATAFERDYGPRVKARMILVRGNIRQANEVWEQAQANPENFDKLAREHSADTNTRSLGGVIPPIRKHGGSPNIEAEAFKLSEGEVSAVVQIEDGEYVILKCEGRTEPVVTEIQDVWEDLMAAQKEELTQKAVAATFEALKAKSEVINYLTGETTRGAVQTASAAE